MHKAPIETEIIKTCYKYFNPIESYFLPYLIELKY